jgi:hypothetical protein
MKRLPIGIQTFKEMVTENYLYVDKTEYIYKLLSNGGKYYFLSRPRRFGKSLLISTLKELFLGNKDYFQNLWIYDKMDWQEHPVIHLDFSGLRYGNRRELTDTLEYLVNQNARANNVELTENGYDKRFNQLIIQLSRKNRVVILVDEYDKPIIDFIDKPEIAMANRDILRGFFTSIKGADEYIKFALLTGVSKFSKVSVFSGLNNLNDITVDKKYAPMLGYTHDELLHYFNDRIEALAQEKQIDTASIVADIKDWYNGYSWDGRAFVFNPFSVLSFFSKEEFGNYWFESGTPSFLMKLIKDHKLDITQFESYRTGEAIFESFELDKINIAALLFQTGYLTVKSVEPIDRTRRHYILSYPNQEVKESFLEHLLSDYSGRFPNEISILVYDLKKSLQSRNLDKFVEIMNSVFASISYNIFINDMEAYYHSVIYLTLMLLGIDVQTEIQTNRGRIDAIVAMDNTLFIMEFKLGTALEAINQIKQKKYYEKFQHLSSHSIYIIGIGIDTQNRNLSSYLLEKV